MLRTEFGRTDRFSVNIISTRDSLAEPDEILHFHTQAYLCRCCLAVLVRNL